MLSRLLFLVWLSARWEESLLPCLPARVLYDVTRMSALFLLPLSGFVILVENHVYVASCLHPVARMVLHCKVVPTWLVVSCHCLWGVVTAVAGINFAFCRRECFSFVTKKMKVARDWSLSYSVIIYSSFWTACFTFLSFFFSFLVLEGVSLTGSLLVTFTKSLRDIYS